ncbi:MAG: hypothetical protein IKK91_09590 [Ruminococcus sp.]|nr:hypothetical protein [Ruminococcus sp.]
MHGKVVGYGCVSSCQHSVRDDRFLSESEIEWRKNTKAAEDIQKVTDAMKKLRDLFLPEDVIVIDVIGGSYRRRHHLEECLKNMSYGDSIVIASINSLGLNSEELLKNYKKIFKKRIGLLLPDYSQKSGLSKYSTTDYAFSPVSISEEEFKTLCSELSMIEIKSNRGRKTIKLTEEFKEVYWFYERYLIDPVTACKNRYFNISKNTFRKLCDEYEASGKYNDDLEYQDKTHQVSRLPKRHGVINDTMENLILDVVVGRRTLENACGIYGINLSRLQYIRYNLKYYCKKGGALKKTFELRDYELIESLQPRYEP